MSTYLIDGGSHIDQALTNLAVRGFSGASGNIADQIFPIVDVANQSNNYYVIDKDSWLRVPKTLRAPLAPANLVEWKVSSEQYFADNYALGNIIAKETIANADLAVQPRENSTLFVTEAMARDREVRVADLLTTSGNLGSTLGLVSSHAVAGSVSFTNVNSSDPEASVTSAHAYIQNNTGLIANTLALDWNVYSLLKLNSKIRNALQYTNPQPVPDNLLASLFNVERILVSKGIKNNAKEEQTASLTAIWGTSCVLAHVENPRGLQTSTVGLQMRWRPAGFPAPMAIQRFDHFDRTRNAEVIHGQYFSDEKIVASELGVLIVNG